MPLNRFKFVLSTLLGHQFYTNTLSKEELERIARDKHTFMNQLSKDVGEKIIHTRVNSEFDTILDSPTVKTNYEVMQIEESEASEKIRIIKVRDTIIPPEVDWEFSSESGKRSTHPNNSPFFPKKFKK